MIILIPKFWKFDYELQIEELIAVLSSKCTLKWKIMKIYSIFNELDNRETEIGYPHYTFFKPFRGNIFNRCFRFNIIIFSRIFLAYSLEKILKLCSYRAFHLTCSFVLLTKFEFFLCFLLLFWMFFHFINIWRLQDIIW